MGACNNGEEGALTLPLPHSEISDIMCYIAKFNIFKMLLLFCCLEKNSAGVFSSKKNSAGAHAPGHHYLYLNEISIPQNIKLWFVKCH